MATLPEVISNGELPVLDDWEPLSRKRILRYFDRSLEYADVSAYVSAQGELLPDERIILVFLNAVYTQSLATVELYCRYVVELLNYARKPSFSVTARDVESYIRQCRMKGLKPRSVNTIIGALKSYFKRLASVIFCFDNSCQSLRRAFKVSIFPPPGGFVSWDTDINLTPSLLPPSSGLSIEQPTK